MIWVQRHLDSFWKGLLIGILFPGLLFFFYWMFFQNQLRFPAGLIRYLIGGRMLSDMIKLCGIGNLLLFYFGINQKIDKFSKGVIASVLLYVGLVAYLMFYVEPSID